MEKEGKNALEMAKEKEEKDKEGTEEKSGRALTITSIGLIPWITK
jgi:hypothetical protein